jgi:hypothetical protein
MSQLQTSNQSPRIHQWGMSVIVVLLSPKLSLCRLLPSPYSDVFFIGGIAILISSAVQSWFWAGLALLADQLDVPTENLILDEVGLNRQSAPVCAERIRGRGSRTRQSLQTLRIARSRSPCAESL